MQSQNHVSVLDIVLCNVTFLNISISTKQWNLVPNLLKIAQSAVFLWNKAIQF